MKMRGNHKQLKQFFPNHYVTSFQTAFPVEDIERLSVPSPPESGKRDFVSRHKTIFPPSMVPNIELTYDCEHSVCQMVNSFAEAANVEVILKEAVIPGEVTMSSCPKMVCCFMFVFHQSDVAWEN